MVEGFKRRWGDLMRILIVATHDGTAMHAQTSQTVSAVLCLTKAYDVLVVGSSSAAIVDACVKLPGCNKVIAVENTELMQSTAETLVDVFAGFLQDYDALVFASNTYSKNVLPRIAARCDISPITDVCEVVDQRTFKRPIYAGNAIATVQTRQLKNIVSIRTASFTAAKLLDHQAEIEKQTVEVNDQQQAKILRHEKASTDKLDLRSCPVVLSGGRGLGSAEGFNKLKSLAVTMNAAIGASRAAVDAGFISNDYQVGQTGKIIAPDVYYAFGISGAIQHLAGMKDSRIIIAINKDPDAAIFTYADYGVVADVFEVIAVIETHLKSRSR
jgi:electron transfer flavoprotein alpha subunit